MTRGQTIIFIFITFFLLCSAIPLLFCMYNNHFFNTLIESDVNGKEIIVKDYLKNDNNTIATGLIFSQQEVCGYKSVEKASTPIILPIFIPTDKPECPITVKITGNYTFANYTFSVNSKTLADYETEVETQRTYIMTEFDFIAKDTQYHVYGIIKGNVLTAYCIFENRSDVVNFIKHYNMYNTKEIIGIMILMPLIVLALIIMIVWIIAMIVFLGIKINECCTISDETRRFSTGTNQQYV